MFEFIVKDGIEMFVYSSDDGVAGRNGDLTLVQASAGPRFVDYGLMAVGGGSAPKRLVSESQRARSGTGLLVPIFVDAAHVTRREAS